MRDKEKFSARRPKRSASDGRDLALMFLLALACVGLAWALAIG